MGFAWSPGISKESYNRDIKINNYHSQVGATVDNIAWAEDLMLDTTESYNALSIFSFDHDI